MPVLSEMAVEPTSIAGLWTVQARQIKDERGVIREFYRHSVFEAAGLPVVIDQINITQSGLGAIRGVHGEDMHKLLCVAHGRVHAKIVCPNPMVVLEFDLEPGRGLFVSAGLGNSFQSLTPDSQYVYGFSMEWKPDLPGYGICPLDPAVGEWPIAIDPENRAHVSEKDISLPNLNQVVSRRR